MQKTTPRAFTRADVEQFFNAYWGKIDYPKNELLHVALLPELDPPTWLIHYQATWRDGDTNYHDLVVSQFPTTLADSSYFLNLVTEVKIPQGCKSVAEEDREIKQREEAEQAAWEKREQASTNPLRKPCHEARSSTIDHRAGQPVSAHHCQPGRILHQMCQEWWRLSCAPGAQESQAHPLD